MSTKAPAVSKSPSISRRFRPLSMTCVSPELRGLPGRSGTPRNPSSKPGMHAPPQGSHRRPAEHYLIVGIAITYLQPDAAARVMSKRAILIVWSDNASVTSLASAHGIGGHTMSARRTALLATLLAALTVTLGATTSARAVTEVPPPLPPDEATTLAAAAAAVPDGSSTQPADGSTALDAASLPEAQTSIESGISAQAAVGLAPLIGGNVIAKS